MKSLAQQLISIKDDMHSKWYELQLSKRSNGGHAFLQRPLLDEIIKLGHQAVDLLKNAAAGYQGLADMEFWLHETELKQWTADDITHFGYLPYYVMQPKRGRELITRDINQLANSIHRAGMKHLVEGGNYCGCRMEEEAQLNEVNDGTLAYCQGSLLHSGGRGERMSWILPGGARVEHRPGVATTHANVIEFTPTETGYDVKMDYTESGDVSWRDRQEGVVNAVESRGGSCTRDHVFTKCEMKNADPDDIRFIALVISQLKDIDLMDDGCVPLAMGAVNRQATELSAHKDKEEIYLSPWSLAGDFKEVLDCVAGKEPDPEREEDRERAIARRAYNDIEFCKSVINSSLASAQKMSCTPYPYVYATPGAWVKNIKEHCDDLKKKTTEPYGWCLDLAAEKEAEIKETAKGLIERCPPEPIILGVEGSGRSSKTHFLSAMEAVCKIAEDQHCLDILAQVAKRKEEGVTATKLPI